MSGQTSFYGEIQAADESWQLLMDGEKPAYLAEWGNRSFKQWVFDGEHREAAGAPPPAREGLPGDASEAARGSLMAEILEHQHVGWLWLHDLMRTADTETQAWVARELAPALGERGIDTGVTVRLIVATD